MISKEEVLKLAELARLQLSEEETVSLQKDISSILDYVGQVSAVSVGDAGADMPLLRNVMREDAPRIPDDALAGKEEKLRSAFPKQENGYNVVRQIINKEEIQKDE